MSVNPSNLIAAQTNPGKTVFPNLARQRGDEAQWPHADETVMQELSLAGIECHGPFEYLRDREVPAA